MNRPASTCAFFLLLGVIGCGSNTATNIDSEPVIDRICTVIQQTLQFCPEFDPRAAVPNQDFCVSSLAGAVQSCKDSVSSFSACVHEKQCDAAVSACLDDYERIKSTCPDLIGFTVD